jgi:hypothetical protein
VRSQLRHHRPLGDRRQSCADCPCCFCRRLSSAIFWFATAKRFARRPARETEAYAAQPDDGRPRPRPQHPTVQPRPRHDAALAARCTAAARPRTEPDRGADDPAPRERPRRRRCGGPPRQPAHRSRHGEARRRRPDRAAGLRGPAGPRGPADAVAAASACAAKNTAAGAPRQENERRRRSRGSRERPPAQTQARQRPGHRQLRPGAQQLGSQGDRARRAGAQRPLTPAPPENAPALSDCVTPRALRLAPR